MQPQDESNPADAKPEESLLNGVAKSTEPLPESDSNAEVSGDVKPAVASTESAQDSAQSGTVRQREDDADEEPAAKRAKVDEPQPAQKDTAVAPSPTPAPATESKPDVAKPIPASTPRTESTVASTERPAAAERPASSVPSSEPRKREAKYSTTPMTGVQKSFLIEKLKNTKKTKHEIGRAHV